MTNELKAAARSLKTFYFGEVSQTDPAGFVGIGQDEIHMYVHASKKAWSGKHLSTWEGYPIVWHYKVGPIVPLGA